MKKTIIAVFAMASLAASAAWEKAVTVQVADVSTITKAVAKLGEITGNQMLGAMTAGYFANPPGAEFFGPMRPGSLAMIPVYFDTSAFEKNLEDFDDKVEFAVLYPIAEGKAGFAKRHPGAVETNGLLRVKGSILDPEDEDDESFVGFSPDGKWAAVSDKPWQVKAALKEVSEAKLCGGELIKLSVTSKGLAIFRKMAELYAAEAKKNKKDFDTSALALLAEFDSIALGICIGDMGLDFAGMLKAVPGTEFAKIGLKTLPTDPFAFAGANALAAQAEYGLCPKDGRAGQWSRLIDLLRRHGIDTSKWLTVETNGDVMRQRLDAGALVKYIESDATNQLAKIDVEKFIEDFKVFNAANGKVMAAERPSFSSFEIVGYKPVHTLSARFAATMPEAKGKKLVQASVCSLAALVQALVPHVMAAIPEKDRAEIQPFLAFLPQESAGGIASMAWPENGELRFVTRLSADELKGVSTAVTAVMAVSAAKQSAGKKGK